MKFSASLVISLQYKQLRSCSDKKRTIKKVFRIFNASPRRTKPSAIAEERRQNLDSKLKFKGSQAPQAWLKQFVFWYSNCKVIIK